MSVLKRYWFGAIQKIIELVNSCFTDYGEVLMFHQVTDDCNEWDDHQCCITQHSFEKLINSLVNQDNSFFALDMISKEVTCHAKYITFDDAYMDVLTHAVPIMVQNNIPFTVFVSTDFLGKSKYLTVEALRHLAEISLCTIGAHTVSHPILRSISKKKAAYEIEASGKILSEYIGKPIELFAYPYGSVFACSAKNRAQVKAAGYKMGYSTLNCSLNALSIKNKWFLPRRNVNEMNFSRYIKE